MKFEVAKVRGANYGWKLSPMVLGMAVKQAYQHLIKFQELFFS
jgi:hypothetical protein